MSTPRRNKQRDGHVELVRTMRYPNGPLLESPGQLAVIAIVAWLIGALIHPLAFLVPLALLVLIGAGVGYALRPRHHTMYWRGRQIDLSDQQSSTERLYRSIFRH